jgi:elongation factor P
MNNDNFEQMNYPNSLISEKQKLLEDGMKLTFKLVEDKVIGVNFPKNLKVEIKTADAVVKGQTASSSYKNALTTNDLKILVPPHIKDGEKIIISSEDLSYVEKAKD